MFNAKCKHSPTDRSLTSPNRSSDFRFTRADGPEIASDLTYTEKGADAMHCDNFTEIDLPAADFQVSECDLVVEVQQIKKELRTTRLISDAHVRLSDACFCPPAGFVCVFLSALLLHLPVRLFVLPLRFAVRLFAFLLCLSLACFEVLLSEWHKLIAYLCRFSSVGIERIVQPRR
jgi:hypothetical protein